jgi:phthalate 4,5-cis-dihydrodiol dehydrogenase
VAASIVYSGYDHFDSDELSAWVGEGGQMVAAHHGSARRTLRALTGEDEERRARKERYGYGSQSAARSSSHPHQPRFGFLVASCQNADLRQTADGVVAYTGEGVREIAIPASRGRPGRVLDELCASVLEGVQPVHNGAFARGTVETCLAIQQSSAARTEIRLETLGREN